MKKVKRKTLPSYYLYYTGKTSALTPVKGSITVEAAIAVPIFLFAVVCMIYLFEIMAVQTAVRSGISYAGRIAAEESYPLSILDSGSIEKDVVNAIGANRLERSIVVGGSNGIDCSDSYMSIRTGIGKIVAKYRIRIPVPMFLIDGMECTESIRIKAWTGYEKGFAETIDDEIVYITETGLVFHRNYHCTYLELSIQMVNIDSISDCRNDNGGKYYACEVCDGGNNNQVYITNTGNKYHGTLSCSRLKRTVSAVPLSEAVGKGACIRCGS